MISTDSFVFYRSFLDAISEMDGKDQLAMFWALCNYALDGAEPQLESAITRAVFSAVKPSIKVNNARRTGGTKGGRPKAETSDTTGKNLSSASGKPMVSANENLSSASGKPCTYIYEDVYEDVDVNEDVNEDEDVNANADEDTHRGATAPSVSPAPKRRAAFTPPTLEEVTAYCRERGGKVDPQTWMDFYTANGWKVGKNPMRDWKASVRTWERNSNFAPKRSGKEPIAPQSADAQRDDIQWLQAFMGKHGAEFGGGTP